MEVAVTSQPVEFKLESPYSSPCLTPPSSPDLLFFSAPTTPRRSSASSPPANTLSVSPPSPEKNPETHRINDEHDKFEFDFSGHLDRTPLSAEELFSEGKIKPMISIPSFNSYTMEKTEHPLNRGMENRGNLGRNSTLSSSPLRISDFVFASYDHGSVSIKPKRSSSSSSSSSSLPATSSFLGTCRKWRARGFLLFRSSSEGRPAAGKEALSKYAVLSKKSDEVQGSSFRSVSGSGSGSARRGSVSAHEMHYTSKRAIAEEMRHKTFLPYKPDLLGCLRFGSGGLKAGLKV